MEKDKNNSKKNERFTWHEVAGGKCRGTVCEMPRRRIGVRLSPSLQAMLNKTECNYKPAA